jgi:hypothetical protein
MSRKMPGPCQEDQIIEVTAAYYFTRRDSKLFIRKKRVNCHKIKAGRRAE